MTAHILIVEDDEMVQGFLNLHLEKEGYRTTAVATGAEMMAALEEGGFDLILLDLGLPDGDGLSLARQVREGSSIPIVVSTARQGTDDRLMALGLGADDYLTKPYDPRELALRVRNVLGRTTGTPVGGGHRPQVEAPFPEVPAADPAAPSRRGGGLAFGGLAGVIIFVLGAAWFMTGREEPSSDTAWVVDSGCPRLPVVEWWAVNDHAAVVRYVQDKHEGDWQPYIRKWTRQHDKMRDIHDRGSTAVTRDGHRLSSQKLAAHIIKIENRLAVIRCLAAAEKRLSGR
jgi:CheY-like chemotaxis protein